jgi:DUF917 family protein
MQKITSVDKDNLEAIAIGGAVLGSGGGGDPYVGRLMTNQILEKAEPVKVIEVETLNDDELILPIAMMGAPTVMMEKFPSGNEFTQLVSMMEKLMQKKVSAILCIEAGGLNSTIPFVAAAKLGLPIVDGDAMGRAFPELQMVSMTMFDIHACPMAMADEKGNALVLNTVDNLSTEKFARVITVEMGGAGLIALYPMTGAEAKKSILRGSLSLISNIGQIISYEQTANRNPADKLASELNGVRLFEGRITDVERRTEGGFARGQAIIQGLEAYQGRSMKLNFQNEFLLAEDNKGKPLAMTPDLICLLDLETGQPITTETMGYGYRVIVFGLPCDPKWRSKHVCYIDRKSIQFGPSNRGKQRSICYSMDCC